MPAQNISKLARGFYHGLLALFVITLTVGCGKSQASPTPKIEIVDIQITSVAPPQPTETYAFRTSQPGTATLHGLLIVLDPTVMLPSPKDAVHLVPLDDDIQGPSGIPTFTEGEVPQADVDERTGEFLFTDIMPGKYALVVVTMGGAQIPARRIDNRSLVIIDVDESYLDKTTDIGLLSLP